MRLLTFALVVAAAAADDSKNETLDEGYSLAGLQLNLSTCDLFIVALAMAENSPLIDSFEAGPAETLRQEPHLARCAVGADSPLTGPGPGHLAASPMLVAGTTPVFTTPHGGTAAIYAVLDRKYTALGALGLSGRCDMDKADAGGKTPADWARRSNDENALLVLREAKPDTAYGRNIFQATPEKSEL